MAALLFTGCLLDDPYYIDETLAETTGEDDAPEGPGLVGQDPSMADTEVEPDSTPPNRAEPDVVVPVPPVSDDDILVEPNSNPGEPEQVVEPAPVVEPSTAVEPEQVLEPSPEGPVVVEPSAEPVGNVDSGVVPQEPVPEPMPEPSVSPDSDAGVCEPGSADCAPMSGCGNGVLDPGEPCDGEELGVESCASQEFSGGLISCSASCELDTSECISGASCEADADGSTGLIYTANLAGKGNNVRRYSCSLGGRDTTDISLAWTAPSTGCFHISVDSPEAIDTIIAVFEDCSTAKELACDDEHGPMNPDSILEFDAVQNTTYAIVVDAYEPGDQGVIEVTVTTCEEAAVWTCGAPQQGDGKTCDCGCGKLDPDCDDETSASCDTCNCGLSGCFGVNATENWLCGADSPFAR